MLASLKKSLYFPIAYYFRFFASIKLNFWKPRVIVATGSIGKTTLFELLRSQIPATDAYFANHVNSTYGIPVNILGLNIKNPNLLTWLNLFISAPFALFKPYPKQKTYIVEADCDRPGEGKFLSELLLPEITVWVSSTNTHSANFDYLLTEKKFKNVEEAIAYEYGYFAQNTSKLLIANTDFQPIDQQLTRSQADVIKITKKKYLQKYEVSSRGTNFEIENKEYRFSSIMPEESFFSIISAEKVTSYLGLPFDKSFKNFEIPSGRGNIFAGVKNSIIIDSSYNASPSAVLNMLDSLEQIATTEKRQAVFLMGDMRELGKEAEEEHIQIAKKINETVDIFFCVGPLTQKFVMPNIKSTIQSHWFPNSKAAGEFISREVPEKSIILVKGSQNEIFLEEAIKELLDNPDNAKKLCRQDDYWKKIKEKLFTK